MWHPTVRDVMTAHEVIKETSKVRTDGFKRSQSSGLKNIGNVLEEARDEEDIYLSAAVYLKKLIEKHPFNDGNKRTAVIVTTRFLEENNKTFKPHKLQETEEIYNVIKWELNSMSIEETAYWIKKGEIK